MIHLYIMCPTILLLDSALYYRQLTFGVVMDIIKDELERNGADKIIIYHIEELLHENVLDYPTSLYHDDLCLPNIYKQLQPTNFGRIVSYLAFVCRISDRLDEGRIREAVRVVIADIKHIDIQKYTRTWFQRFLRTVLNMFGQRHAT